MQFEMRDIFIYKKLHILQDSKKRYSRIGYSKSLYDTSLTQENEYVWGVFANNYFCNDYRTRDEKSQKIKSCIYIQDFISPLKLDSAKRVVALMSHDGILWNQGIPNIKNG